MKVVTYEATVEDGRVRLPEAVHLPENAKAPVLHATLRNTQTRTTVADVTRLTWEEHSPARDA